MLGRSVFLRSGVRILSFHVPLLTATRRKSLECTEHQSTKGSHRILSAHEVAALFGFSFWHSSLQGLLLFSDLETTTHGLCTPGCMF